MGGRGEEYLGRFLSLWQTCSSISAFASSPLYYTRASDHDLLPFHPAIARSRSPTQHSPRLTLLRKPQSASQ